jgi:hypothetical protein
MGNNNNNNGLSKTICLCFNTPGGVGSCTSFLIWICVGLNDVHSSSFHILDDDLYLMEEEDNISHVESEIPWMRCLAVNRND